jgi:serine/threonine-protein kinase
VTQPRLAVGAIVAGLRVESLIAEGATGSVFLATDAAGNPVALKVLGAELADDERFRRRFLRESELAASLHHRHIVPTIASGEEDGVLYLAMAYIDGHDLRELLRREGRLEPARVLGVLGQVADALDAAHSAGLVHRDVKPGNILIEDGPGGEHAYVCDFGLARYLSSPSSLTGDRGFVGTVDYIPPEQIEGGEIDGRADVYSLGCVLYECLSGARPFDRDTELSVVFAHLNEPPPSLSDIGILFPDAFDSVFATALAKAPGDRFATCGELVEAAQAALKGGVTRRRTPRRRRWVIAAVALLVAVGVAVGVLATRETSSAAITQSSIAGVRLGLDHAKVRKLFADTSRAETPAGGTPGHAGTDYPRLFFGGQKVGAYFADSGPDRVIIATTWNKAFKTDRGIGPCSTIAELKKAYGAELIPDPYATNPRPDGNGSMVSTYMVGRNLLFSASDGQTYPATYVTAIALYDGSAPHAQENNGANPFASFVLGNESPHCVR